MASRPHKVFYVILVVFFFSGQSAAGVKAAHWLASGRLDSDDINATLFTHLYFGFIGVDTSTFEVSGSQSSVLSSFNSAVKRKNPQLKTLISISNSDYEDENSLFEQWNFPVLSSVVSESSRRKSLINSSISAARVHGFDGLDLFWIWPNSTDIVSIGVLLDEWRAAITSEKRSMDQPPLILTMAVHYSPEMGSVSYPIESIKRNVDWVNVIAYNYHTPLEENFTAFHSALYDSSSHINTDFGITQWLNRGFPAQKMVLGLPFHGYSWFVKSEHKSVGVAASGPGLAGGLTGLMGYKEIKSYIVVDEPGGVAVYNETYVANVYISKWDWINFDGMEAIRGKVLYVKRKGLLGYHAFQLGNDGKKFRVISSSVEMGRNEFFNATLTAQSAAHHQEKSNREKKHPPPDQEKTNGRNKGRLLLVLLLLFVPMTILTTLTIHQFRRRIFINKKVGYSHSRSCFSRINRPKEKFGTDALHVQVYSLKDIKVATNNFSNANKLGQGGYGPVYKGTLPMGQEVAVKRLSATSNQGHEEFQNEVTLTARLQHVNLVRVLGYCTEMEENLLLYEYMPNKSLDLYLFDPIRRYTLHWRKRVQIIEGIIQGLLYLQEYSNITVIHRDLKASNILLDSEMNPKISDFWMAKLFKKDVLEANTGRIVGTFGFVPPEYVRKGIYSMKYDVYSFGVLVLQIISGKRTACHYGLEENLSLFEYAYESWNCSNILDFMDTSLDDSSSTCEISRCLHIALLCIQEDPRDRPSMFEVLSMLKNASVAIATPKRPAFSLERSLSFCSTSTSELEMPSYSS